MQGPAQFSKAVSDFVTAWGDFGSVAGLIVGLVGFYITVGAALKAKRAAELAEEAARQAKERIVGQMRLIDFSSAITIMENLIPLHRQKKWQDALDRHAELRRLLTGARGGGTEQQKTQIQASIEQFKTMESEIEKHLCQHKPEPNSNAMNDVVRNQIGKIQDISEFLKNE